jgi:hypothetical protein
MTSLPAAHAIKTLGEAPRPHARPGAASGPVNVAVIVGRSSGVHGRAIAGLTARVSAGVSAGRTVGRIALRAAGRIVKDRAAARC